MERNSRPFKMGLCPQQQLLLLWRYEQNDLSMEERRSLLLHQLLAFKTSPSRHFLLDYSLLIDYLLVNNHFNISYLYFTKTMKTDNHLRNLHSIDIDIMGMTRYHFETQTINTGASKILRRIRRILNGY